MKYSSFFCKYLLKDWLNSALFNMNSLSFSSLIFVNSEPIEQNLNSIFANKYNKI